MLGRGREPDDVRAVVGEHGLADFNVPNMLSGVKKLMSGWTSQADCARFLWQSHAMMLESLIKSLVK